MNNQIDMQPGNRSRPALATREHAYAPRLTNEEIRRQLGWNLFGDARYFASETVSEMRPAALPDAR